MKRIAQGLLSGLPFPAISRPLWRLTCFLALMGTISCMPPADAGDITGQLGLPAAIPADQGSPARIALGRKLFFDKRLSGDGTISCASCHQPERAFTDGLGTSRGIGQKLGTRNTPSLINAAFNETQFWDGRRKDLESQALDPFTNPREHGLSDPAELIGILQRDTTYQKDFQEAFPHALNPISLDHVAQALSNFERTLTSGGSAFDRYYFNGEKNALSDAAVRGLALFQGAARCATCHTVKRAHATFTDNRFHSLSVGLPRLAPSLAQLTMRLAQAKAAGNILDHTVLGEEDIAQLGRFAVTLDPRDIGTFRTPSLRNVADTAPYMHDGSVATLEEAVDLEIYYRSTQMDRPLVLTAGEKADIVEFLRALSSPYANR